MLLILSGVPPVWVCWPQSVAVMTRTVCCAVCTVQSRPPPRHHRHCQHSVSRETGGGRGRTELWLAEHQHISGLIFTATEYAVPDLDNIQTGWARGQHSPPLSLSLSLISSISISRYEKIKQILCLHLTVCLWSSPSVSSDKTISYPLQ